jgi:hypothetical protein
MKNLPKFTGEGDLTATEHINFFDQFADILGLEHEDVYSRLFVQTFEGQVRTWFRSLPAGSILSYDALEDSFLRQWGERKDHLYYLTEFGSLKKKSSETVMEFIQRFNKLYNKIPVEVKPSQPAAKVTFAGAFEPDFALLLRERRGADLTRMQDDAMEIESNMMASGKLKTKIEMGNRETKRFKEQAGPSGSGRSSDDKIDDMARIIKELSNKISRMELDQSKADQFVKRDFRRNPNPQIQQRQIKNEDQKIQTPLKNENFIGGNDLQEFEDLGEDVNNLGDDCVQPHLTKEDYERSLNTEQPSNKDNNINNAGDSTYQGMVDTIMAELQHKYNLRPKNKSVSTTQPKKILPRGETYEPIPKDTEIQNTKIKEAEVQAGKIKVAGTQTLETKLTENKAMQTNKLERKETEASTKETDKLVGGFSLENEINKIKIPIPLVELAKNPVYRKQITKMINFSDLESQSDVINLEDDKPNITFGPHFEGARDTVAPFYITLNVQDRLLHNCMLDSGASHNVMPKSIMDRLGLEITRPYRDLYSFDSRRVKCMGMIKDLVVTLAQVPVKNVLMDVVIV